MPAEIIGTLFTPFVTTKPHGLGIGLVIAQRIVEAHGGAISAQQNPDGGATFTVTVPVSAPTEALVGGPERSRGISEARPRTQAMETTKDVGT